MRCDGRIFSSDGNFTFGEFRRGWRIFRSTMKYLMVKVGSVRIWGVEARPYDSGFGIDDPRKWDQT